MPYREYTRRKMVDDPPGPAGDGDVVVGVGLGVDQRSYVHAVVALGSKVLRNRAQPMSMWRATRSTYWDDQSWRRPSGGASPFR